MRRRVWATVRRIARVREPEVMRASSLLLPAEIVHAHRIALTLSHLRIPHDHALRLARIDREDPHAQQPVTHPLHERRILHPRHDLFIHLPSLRRTHRLAAHHVAVDGELEILERRPMRHRVHVVRLRHPPAAVDERFGYFIPRNAAHQLHAHVAGHALQHRSRRRAKAAVHLRATRPFDDGALRQRA